MSNSVVNHPKIFGLNVGAHKDITITYNFLNLPSQIVKTGAGGGTISLTYDAAGRKWRKQVTGVTKDYCQGIEYKDGKVEAVYGAEGRLTAVYDEYGVTLTRFRAEYWLKDHLGNTRLAFADENHNGTIEVWDDPSTPENEAEIVQENHYYPFGMNHEGPWYATIGPRNGYQYNGKELNEELELGWNDFGARWQDPATGRWWQVDPLADGYPNVSAYAFVFNNPLIYIDPSGAKIDVADILKKDKKGNYVNPDLALAFLSFAQSDLGKQILANFAQAGQIIAGHKYKESGKFHKQGIDLSFYAWEGNYKQEGGYSTGFGANGVTRFVDNGDGTADIQIHINKELNSSSNDAAAFYQSSPSDPEAQLNFQLSRTSTIFHETIIHAESDAIDFIDDCIVNCSNYPDHYGINVNSERGKQKIHHISARRTSSKYTQKGIPAIINLYKEKGSNLSPSQVRNQLLNFND